LKLAAKFADWLSSARIGSFGALAVLAALYCALQIVVMPALSAWIGTGVGVDDAEQLMYMRFFWAGYGGSQPPLFTWLLWLVSTVFGTSIFTLKVVKYGLYLVTLLAVFAVVTRSGYSRRAAAAAALGLFLFPQFLWEMQHSLSHSVAAVCFSAVLLLACFEMLHSRSNLAYAAFGLAMGLAILGKYNNFILIGALLTAALSLRQTRDAILTPRFATSVAIALLVCLPTL
jgi:4-amino-4-deoxy-L-arabinose transferase-like glycosyltransferase